MLFIIIFTALQAWGGDSHVAAQKYVIVVEHDLAILDYMSGECPAVAPAVAPAVCPSPNPVRSPLSSFLHSDFICCLYGEAGAYLILIHTAFPAVNPLSHLCCSLCCT